MYVKELYFKEAKKNGNRDNGVLTRPAALNGLQTTPQGILAL